MKKTLLLVALLVLLAGNFGHLGQTLAQPSLLLAQVTRVVDGDTIEVLLAGGSSERVRYIGMDTPETVDPSEPVGCFGPEASQYNKSLVENRTVWLELDVEQRDRYGRLLAYVHLSSDGQTMVNAILVSQGFAQIATYPPNVKYVDRFLELEREARTEDRGLWGACQTSSTGSSQAPATTTATSGAVVINELDQNPPGTDEGNEWVELFNAGDQPVDIGGWFIVGDYQGIGGREGRINIPAGTTINPGGFLVFVAAGQALDNENEVVELRNSAAEVIDQTPSLSDSGDGCWARVPDGSENWNYQSCSQGTTNGN